MDPELKALLDPSPRRPGAATARHLPLLYWVTLAAAAVLLGLVLLCPALDVGHFRLLGLFARDPAVRRTALAAAIGLTVTACVFFRPPASARVTEPVKPTRPTQPPVVGA